MQGFLEVLGRVDRALTRVMSVLVALLLFALMLIVFIGVIARYFFNYPLTWVDELARMLLISITFVGAYAALSQNKLARITALVDALPPGAKKAVNLLCSLAMLFLLAVVAFKGLEMMGLPVVRKQKTTTLHLPMILFYATIPLSALLMSFHILQSVLRSLLGQDVTEETGEEGYSS